MKIFSKFFNGLKKTKDAISSKIALIFKGRFDDEFFEEMEIILISSDMGAKASMEIVQILKNEVKKQKPKTEEDVKIILRKIMSDMLSFPKEDKLYPKLLCVIGVNGVGKTTTVGKLAHFFKLKNKKVVIVAGDTFRAAASEQLAEWAKKSNTRIVKYSEGVDPGAVVFDGIKSAIAKKDDIVLVDTAGRLQNKINLMDELKKIDKIICREWNSSVLNYLVIDATTGQNALSQVKVFNEILGLDGIIVTKLDGTAKGGVVFAIAKEFNLPVRFVGLGEGLDDLQEFDAVEFANNII